MADQPGKKNVRLRGIFAVAAATGLALGTAFFMDTPHAAQGPGPQPDTTAPQMPSQTAPGKPSKAPHLPRGGTISPNDPSIRNIPPFGIGPDIQPPGIGQHAPNSQVLDDIWRNIVTRDHTPYKPFMTDGGGGTLPPGNGSVTLQLESSYGEVQGLLLSSAYSPLNALERHGGAATGIIQSTERRFAGRDSNILFVERPQSLESWFLNKDDPETQAILRHATILSLSMAFIAKGNPDDAIVGSLTTAADIEESCALWQSSHTFLIWSAGNNGRDAAVDLERPAAYHTMCADAMVRVGEAEEDRSTGRNYIEIWSSRPASFVMKEPFQDGYKYRYYRNSEEARQYIDEIFNATAAGETLTNAQLFERKIANGWFTIKQLQACHPDFRHADFPGKEILRRDKEWMKAHPAEVRAAFENGVVAAAEWEMRDSGADRNGFVGDKRGTSFSAPYFAGLADAAHELYPQLTDYDLMAVALMAADPLTQVRRADGRYNEISYHDNGRGLRHNSFAGGFGLLEADDYMRTARELAGLIAQDPSLATREVWVRSDSMSYAAANASTKSHRDYYIPVGDDNVVLQTVLKLKFAGGDNGVPAKITMINPMGAEITLSPTRTGSTEYSMANTPGNFGNHSRGVWTVRVPANVRVEEAQLILPGFAPGGGLERMLERVTGHAARIANVPVVATPAPATFRPAPAPR